MRELVNVIRISLQFFTILPVAKTIEWTERRVASSILVFPFIGLVIGLCEYGLFRGMSELSISVAVQSMLLVLLPIALTGGLHLDGWMDVSDAYFSRRPKEKRLEILSDPNIGAFAVLSLLFLLSLRWMAIHELLLIKEVPLSMWIVVSSVPRLSAGWVLRVAPLAKDTGLAAYFKQGFTKRISVIYIVITILFAVYACVVSLWLPVAITLLLWTIAFIAWCRKQFGGITGDMIGTTVEGGITLTWISLWLLHLFVTA
ncbi:adenosylcobinamide-GDP ribazoletransferase [Priestia koreensis]|uniref:adenosylcobinamide-GDP ribazoletransferase n=1 Tax=Priestia koreensis TaxID=284581 RepID=UPI001F59467D|nr:adenosylcobinamide-GDP ribazoletransferase [Priestia koreensis]MCM3006432.1 adenosylcobinamide-GDP ribazoletransferase [Priestia koreensis]UNL83667.1 adenosylcobinamide-GDP ribazoletransferase [Priestia koreensis]